MQSGHRVKTEGDERDVERYRGRKEIYSTVHSVLQYYNKQTPCNKLLGEDIYIVMDCFVWGRNKVREVERVREKLGRRDYGGRSWSDGNNTERVIAESMLSDGIYRALHNYVQNIHYRSQVWGHLEMFLFLEENLSFLSIKIT